jgi:hypothetical protein
VKKIHEDAGPVGVVRRLATPAGRSDVPAALVFAATEFIDEQLMFFLLAKAYEARPSREAMLWIYERFVKPPKVKGKWEMSYDLEDTARTVNVAASAADRCFELVTGGWARSMKGGAHPDAFAGVLYSMANMLADIDRRFQNAARKPGEQKFIATPTRVRLLDEELKKARAFNLALS